MENGDRRGHGCPSVLRLPAQLRLEKEIKDISQDNLIVVTAGEVTYYRING